MTHSPRLILVTVLFGLACSGSADDPGMEQLTLSDCLAQGGALGQIWSVDNGHGAIHALAASEEGTLALAGTDGSVKLWSVGESEPGWSHQDFSAAYGNEFGEGPVVAALAIQGARIVAGTTAGELRLHEADSGEVMMAAPTGEVAVTSVAVASDGTIAVSDESYSGGLALLDPETEELQPLSRDDQDKHLWGATTVAFAPDDALLAAGDWYGVPAVERWQGGARTAIWIAGPETAELARGGEVTALAFLADGRIVIGGGSQFPEIEKDGFVAVVDPARLEEGPSLVRAIAEHRIAALATLPNGQVVTTGEDGSLRVFDADTLTELTRVDAGASELALVAGGAAAATAGDDGVLRLWGCTE
jgi:WD40 repeat protein